ncbi:cytochrome P450 [Streptomyces sp. NPDC057743]|uniref:cytochrome P450 family protein n=1 Tax=Streptomyces sp. NPDC057743 TaxID=3346236 RepID=UPI003673934D
MTGVHRPAFALDPTGADHHGEDARLRAAGPVVRVQLPDGVVGWVVTHQDLVTDLLVNQAQQLSKDPADWRVELPEGWPLRGMVEVTNMVTADGPEHQRLRRPVTRFLTPGRVLRMRPRIVASVGALLDGLPAHADSAGVVDLRAHLAGPLPLRVICELVGAPEELRGRLMAMTASIFDHTVTPDEVRATQDAIAPLMGALVAHRRAHPGEDLTTALIHRQRCGELTEDELRHTLWLLLTAGFETTCGLLVNAVRALLTHDAQRALAVGGDAATWRAVVEETLRWDSPVAKFLARYARTDLVIAGTTVPAGDAIIVPYTALGRCPSAHGPDAGRFDIGHTTPHRSFGAGPHACPGAALARLQASVALPALFRRYPRLALAVPESALRPNPSLVSNSTRELPVVLGR